MRPSFDQARRVAVGLSDADIDDIVRATGMSADEVLELLETTSPGASRAGAHFAPPPMPPRMPASPPAPPPMPMPAAAAPSPWGPEVMEAAAATGESPARVAAWLNMAAQPQQRQPGPQEMVFSLGLAAGAPPELAYAAGMSLLGAAATAGTVTAGPTPGAAEADHLAYAAMQGRFQ